MIALSVPVLGGNEARYLLECVDTGFVSSVGPFVGQFEQRVAEITGVAHAVSTCSGTSALHMMLMAFGVEPEDLVIMPSFTFIATANAVRHAGAVPWLFDIDPDTWCLAPAAVARELDRQTERLGGSLVHCVTRRRISAILTVHTLGFAGDLGGLRIVADRYGLPLLADGAASIGAQYGAEPVGRAPVDATALSFNGNKVVTTGGGGAVVSGRRTEIEWIRHVTTTARVNENYEHDMVGYNLRLTNLGAAVGCAQLEQLSGFVRCRRAIQDFYTHALASTSVWDAPPASATTGSGWLATMRYRSKYPDGMRMIRTKLREAGIDSRSFWRPVHMQIPYADVPRTDCPHTEDLWWRVMTLPTTPTLTRTELDRIVESVRAASDGTSMSAASHAV